MSIAEGIEPRLNRRGEDGADHDEAVAALQYRDSAEFVVGHAISAAAQLDADGVCRTVRSTWIPSAHVERLEAAAIPEVTLGMEALAGCATYAELQAMLGKLGVRYQEWIARQRDVIRQGQPHFETTRKLLDNAEVCRRPDRGRPRLLEDPTAFDAFRLAKRSWPPRPASRGAQLRKLAPEAVAAPAWRPFQLAFLLMNLPGIADPTHADREMVDLLFFPTGGGKTEAYLGLAAFTLVLRRLRHPGHRLGRA